MPTLFAVYNLHEEQLSESYDKYLIDKKIPGMRGAPWCTDFHTWKIDTVFGPAVSELKGELPAKSPYQYIAKMEVADMDALVDFLGTDAGKQFVRSWSVYVDSTTIFTSGHEV